MDPSGRQEQPQLLVSNINCISTLTISMEVFGIILLQLLLPCTQVNKNPNVKIKWLLILPN